MDHETSLPLPISPYKPTSSPFTAKRQALLEGGDVLERRLPSFTWQQKPYVLDENLVRDSKFGVTFLSSRVIGAVTVWTQTSDGSLASACCPSVFGLQTLGCCATLHV